MFIVALIALAAAQSAPPRQSIELKGHIRESLVESMVTVDADGIIAKCEPAPRPYANVPPPPDLCSAYPVGARFGPPTTANGKPQRRKVRIRIETTDQNISG